MLIWYVNILLIKWSESNHVQRRANYVLFIAKQFQVPIATGITHHNLPDYVERNNDVDAEHHIRIRTRDFVYSGCIILVFYIFLYIIIIFYVCFVLTILAIQNQKLYVHVCANVTTPIRVANLLRYFSV
jgi:hypothetical protein